MNDAATFPYKRPSHRLLWAALLVGLAFRLAGLSHDLDAGYIYHPDTPKQMRAVERFLDENYYTHTGLSDYDGYPLFHAHLVEYAVRAFRWIADPVVALMGIPGHIGDPKIMTLYWLARLLSVALATLLIYIVYRIGLESQSRGAGLVAAWLLALSPVDMVSAHYESGDTTAGFFAVLTVLFAVRIYHHGRYRDYAWAGLAGMCAFAAKYHAGMGLIPVGVAHLLRQKNLKSLFSAESVRAMAVLAAVCIIGFFLANPAMFEHPAIVPREIWEFLHHVSSGERLPENFKNANFFGRFTFSMHRHLPVLAGVLSWPVCACVLAGLIHLLRADRRLAILYTMPLVYFLVGVTLRPLAHPVYHTLMTPLLFVITAIVVFRVPAALRVLLVAVSCYQLAHVSMKEAFYFQHRDTRRMAEAWTYENIPLSFAADRSRYAFNLGGFGQPGPGPQGQLFVQSGIRSEPAPTKNFLLKRFRLEDRSIPFFRNPVQDIYLGHSHAIRRNFTLPVYQRIPSRTGNEMIFQPDRAFYRSEQVLRMDGPDAVRRVVVSDQPLEDAMIVVRNGRLPGDVDLALGERKQRFHLRPGEARVAYFDSLSRSWLSEDDRYFYRWSTSLPWGRARVQLAFTPEEKGVALYNQGEFAMALPWLLEAHQSNRNQPTLAAMALLASRMGDTAIPRATLDELFSATAWLKDGITAGEVFDHFGVSPEYLRALPYETWEAEALLNSGFSREKICLPGGRALTAVVSATNGDWAIHSPPLFLDPGVYSLTLHARVKPGTPPAVIALDDGIGGRIWEAAVNFPPGLDANFKQVHIRLPVAQALADARAVLSGGPGGGLEIDRISLDPEPLATLEAMGQALRVAYDGAWDREHPSAMLYGPLLTEGDRLVKENSMADAFAAWSTAVKIRPNAVAALERIQRIRSKLTDEQKAAVAESTARFDAAAPAREFHQAEADFQRGARLLGYRIRSSVARAGEQLAMNVYWDMLERTQEARDWVVWVHFLDSEGHSAFQGDHPLMAGLRQPRDNQRIMPDFQKIMVPLGTRPGSYRVQLGLYHPGRNKRIKVDDTRLQILNKGVILPLTIDVEQ